MTTMVSTCPECGALLPRRDGGACQELFHELLALEWRIPGCPGAMAHYLAVTAYNLQHPSAFTPEDRKDMIAGLEGALSGGLTVIGLRQQAQRRYNGSRRVLRQRGIAAGDRRNEAVAGWPRKWPRTILDVPGADLKQDSYHERVREWAETVLAALRSGPDPG